MGNMKSLIGFGIPAAVTIAALFLLAGLYSGGAGHGKSSVAAFQPRNESMVSDESLVDDLNALPLRLTIGKADWNNGTLIVDLKVTEEPFSVRTVYRDLAEMLAFSFSEKENVGHLYLRFMAVDPWTGSRYLLLAARVGRSEWDPGLYTALKGLEEAPLPDRMIQAYHVTITNLWLKQFTPD